MTSVSGRSPATFELVTQLGSRCSYLHYHADAPRACTGFYHHPSHLAGAPSNPRKVSLCVDTVACSGLPRTVRLVPVVHEGLVVRLDVTNVERSFLAGCAGAGRVAYNFTVEKLRANQELWSAEREAGVRFRSERGPFAWSGEPMCDYANAVPVSPWSTSGAIGWRPSPRYYSDRYELATDIDSIAAVREYSLEGDVVRAWLDAPGWGRDRVAPERAQPPPTPPRGGLG